MRVAQEQVWRWLFDRITASPAAAEHATALDLATNWLFAYVDVVLVQAERLYEVEREAWLSGAAAARAAAVDDILTGREDDPQRASKRRRQRHPCPRPDPMGCLNESGWPAISFRCSTRRSSGLGHR